MEERDTDIVEGDFTEVVEEAAGEIIDGALVATEGEVIEADAPKGKMGLDAFLSAITGAVASEQITSRQARELRQNMGIRQGYFTRNRNTDTAKAKAKRQAQKKARKTSRKKK